MPTLNPPLVSEERARVIASEIPLTWRQVSELLAEATAPARGRWGATMAAWIDREDPAVVGEWLWGRWVDQHKGQ